MGCSSFLQPALRTFRLCGEVRLYVRRTNIAQPRRPEIGDQMTLDQTDIGQLIGVDVNERLLVGGGHKGFTGTSRHSEATRYSSAFFFASDRLTVL